MSIETIIMAVLALAGGLFGYKKWSEGQGREEERVKQAAKNLKDARYALEETRNKSEGRIEDLETKEEELQREEKKLVRDIQRLKGETDAEKDPQNMSATERRNHINSFLR